MQVLVVGGTGRIGGPALMKLHADGVHAAAAARSTGFDWGNASSWSPLLEDANAMVIVLPEGQVLYHEFLEMAKAYGITRVVLISSTAIELMGDQRLMEAERLVRASGMDWTILRPEMLCENFCGTYDPTQPGGVRVPFSLERFAFVTAQDVGEVAATVVAQRLRIGQTLEVTGPHALTFPQVFRWLGRLEPVDWEITSPTDPFIEPPGVEPGQPGSARAVAGLVRRGFGEPTDTVRRVLGRAPVTVQDWVTWAHTTGVWPSARS